MTGVQQQSSWECGVNGDACIGPDCPYAFRHEAVYSTPTPQDQPDYPVAALFVQAGGCYYGVEGVDPWDIERDARLYGGPHPVVAHPPCSRWSRLAGFCEARHGLKVGHDEGCFAAALGAVRRFGGVIEHPAFSKAWAHFDLPRPDTKREGWTIAPDGGASCYIEQARYGHPVKKATWLYAFGVELSELRWGHTPDNRGKLATNQDWRGGMDKWRDATGHRVANATPPEFRDALLAIARTAYRVQPRATQLALETA